MFYSPKRAAKLRKQATLAHSPRGSTPFARSQRLLIGSLSNDDGVVNENGKKGTSLNWQTGALHVQHAFLNISLP